MLIGSDSHFLTALRSLPALDETWARCWQALHSSRTGAFDATDKETLMGGRENAHLVRVGTRNDTATADVTLLGEDLTSGKR